MSNGGRALLVVLASSAIGAAYFSYLTAVPFPPGIVRLVPLAWSAACVVGWVWSIRGAPLGRWKGALGRGSRAQRTEYDVRSALPPRSDDGRLTMNPSPGVPRETWPNVTGPTIL